MAATLDARLRLDSSQFSGGLNRALRESNAAVGKMSAQFSTLRNVMGAGIVGGFATGMLSGMFDAAIQAERLQSALSATLGSEGLGKKQLEDIRKMAGEIGLEVNGAAKSMIQFQSAGMTAAESMRTIKAGYNAVMSSGGGAAEFSRMAVALTQLRASPKVLQEELNQLREALPTTAKLMTQAFGVTRAEDIQKLNISGKEFVETMLVAMETLPQVGDTMAKQIGRYTAQVDQFKAKLGETLKPAAQLAMMLGSFVMESSGAVGDSFFNTIAEILYGKENVARSLRARAGVADSAQTAKDEAKALEDVNAAAQKNLATNAKSIADGKTLTGVIAKFDAILKEAAKSARELAAELDFGDRMKAFTDQQDARALEENLKNIKDATAESIRAKREAQAETLPFYGPKQMTPEEEGLRGQAQEEWRKKFAEAGMSRSERKSQREADREAEKNMAKAVNKEARDLLKKERDAARRDGFDNLKKNQFFQDEDAKKRIKDQVRKEADDAAKRSVITLGEIRDILKTLAVA